MKKTIITLILSISFSFSFCQINNITSNKLNKENSKTDKITLENFLKIYKAEKDITPVTDEILEEYRNKVPEVLINLWKSNGFGKYNKGLIEIVNPKDFEPVLWTWLGKKAENYVPFAITGFGELFYYRKLTETDEDVCMIDIQYQNIETVIWSLEKFFEKFLTDKKNRKVFLREKLFNQAISKYGGLAYQEIFTFTPILAFGGLENIEYLKKGNAEIYNLIIIEMVKQR